jgi:transcriptional regulator of aromatic amino acid metabolism
MIGGMTVVNSPDFLSFSDIDLLCALTSSPRRPNLLLDCAEGSAEDVLVRLRALAHRPFFTCSLPGPLELPSSGRGTLLINDIAALTIAQQVMLFDWLQYGRGSIQVISVTQKRMLDMICDGRVLEGLFYRLNTISIRARGASRHVEHAVI